MRLLLPHPPDNCATCGRPVAFTHRDDQFGYAHIEGPVGHPAQPASFNTDNPFRRPDWQNPTTPLFLGLSDP